jgi:hypothetical protein
MMGSSGEVDNGERCSGVVVIEGKKLAAVGQK